MELLGFLFPVLFGGICWWISTRSKGRNARNAFKMAAWGGWLLLLWWVPLPIFPPILGFLNLILSLTPSAICFFLAANSLLKEIRAQKNGEFTDAI